MAVSKSLTNIRLMILDEIHAFNFDDPAQKTLALEIYNGSIESKPLTRTYDRLPYFPIEWLKGHSTNPFVNDTSKTFLSSGTTQSNRSKVNSVETAVFT